MVSFLKSSTSAVALAAFTALASVAAEPHADEHETPKAYKAVITEIPGSNSGVAGIVTVFSSTDETTVGYGGFLTGLEASLEASSAACSATNGCGVHVHSGMSCANATAQGGHYFVDPVMEDPWADARYTSDAEGKATFANMRSIGTDDLEGRPFIVHAADGSRVGCGLLTAVAKADTLPTELEALTDAGVNGTVNAVAIDENKAICYFGDANKLEANLKSIHADDGTATSAATDCTAKNGCGTHVHAGMDCTNSTMQMGHYYNMDMLTADPWAIIGYEATTDAGFAHYVGCVETGHTEYKGKAFIVHANDGSRVACGLMGEEDHDSHDSDESAATARSSQMVALVVTAAAGILSLVAL